jgi:hypothetical protein
MSDPALPSPATDDRTNALRQIAALAERHALTLEDIARVIDSDWAPEPPARSQGLLVRVLGVIGGTFVFAGVAVFIGLQWDGMTSAARVVITLGSGLAAFALAVIAHGDRRFERAATPLFLMAAALVPTGLLVLFDEYGSGGDWRWAVLVTSATVAAQFGAAFTSIRRSTLLFVSAFFATWAAVAMLDLLDIDDEVIALVVGSSVVLAAIGVDRTRHGVITPAWYLSGAVAALGGFFELVRESRAELLFPVVASAVVYLSVAVRSRTLLVVATLAILAYTMWFTSEHFADSVGWPIVLIIFGLLLIGMSALAVRIDRRYLRSDGPRNS